MYRRSHRKSQRTSLRKARRSMRNSGRSGRKHSGHKQFTGFFSAIESYFFVALTEEFRLIPGVSRLIDKLESALFDRKDPMEAKEHVEGWLSYLEQYGYDLITDPLRIIPFANSFIKKIESGLFYNDKQ
jgi:hypothetical protein